MDNPKKAFRLSPEQHAALREFIIDVIWAATDGADPREGEGAVYVNAKELWRDACQSEELRAVMDGHVLSYNGLRKFLLKLTEGSAPALYANPHRPFKGALDLRLGATAWKARMDRVGRPYGPVRERPSSIEERVSPPERVATTVEQPRTVTLLLTGGRRVRFTDVIRLEIEETVTKTVFGG